MAHPGLTIGELARRTAVPVKTLRFYSNEGLLPPARRTASNYRVYGEDAIVRLELIRTLREAGLGIDKIRAVLARELTLAAALRLQLHVVEAHLASLKQVASALRAALRSEPTEQDIMRLTAVTRLSDDERKAMIEGFYDKVADGLPIDAQWKQTMIDASAVRLPDEPTPEQLDAWIELSAIVQDAGFIEAMRTSAAETWTPSFDANAYKQVCDVMVAEARQASARGARPDEPIGKDIVDRCFVGMARAMGEQPDEAFRRSLRQRFEQQDPRAARYWELVAILRGTAPQADPWPVAEWQWFLAASRAHYPG